MTNGEQPTYWLNSRPIDDVVSIIATITVTHMMWQLTMKLISLKGLTSSSSQSTLIAQEALQEVTTALLTPQQPLSYLGHGSPSVSTSAHTIPVVQPSLSPAPLPFPSPLVVRTIPMGQSPTFPSSPPFPLAPFFQTISLEQSPPFPTALPSRPPVLAKTNPVVEPPLPSTSAPHTPFSAQRTLAVEPPLLPTSSLSGPPSSNNAAVFNHTRQKSSLAGGYDRSRDGAANSDVTLVAQSPGFKPGSSAKIPTRTDTTTGTLPAGRMRALQIESKQKPMNWFERGKKFVKDVVTGAMK